MATAKEKTAIKSKYLDLVGDFFRKSGEDVQVTKSNVIAFPVVYPSGEEGYVTITVSIPSGSRDGEAYDAYEAAAEYKFQLEEKAKKAAAKEAEKAKKIERDEKRRASAEAKKAARE